MNNPAAQLSLAPVAAIKHAKPPVPGEHTKPPAAAKHAEETPAAGNKSVAAGKGLVAVKTPGGTEPPTPSFPPSLQPPLTVPRMGLSSTLTPLPSQPRSPLQP
ncbi:hypothetical protein PTTG_04465 [Puccinia triticina 1-1 BBBD Race 1]|uniref:Uncharacterized protein n=1 Tax=Puccinia triticina (isolate 1-1 / race 1 (BBBD)) TaxID=630390 RepID=A0A0C4EUI6_PUCT1|nr:hypothetical protein PTTG_04465 [Puccinia triticina 1-1 BBBD Race 1]